MSKREKWETGGLVCAFFIVTTVGTVIIHGFQDWGFWLWLACLIVILARLGYWGKQDELRKAQARLADA